MQGDSREGPSRTVKLSCFGCCHERSERYRVQSDTGSDVSCVHPDIGGKAVGDTRWDTPDWCPFVVSGKVSKE